ncbi:MAG: Rieske 2Fe-2S domain-containing protein [Pirellulales bacterium]|nr:Rieske 2Fe-2S domain-containing protein [Pirellulales bacterium]
MAQWKPVANVADCPPGSSLETVVDDRIVALFNVDGNIYALDGVCSHQGGPLGKGKLEGCIVTCPWHGWQYDVQSGANEVNKSVTQPSFETKIVDGQICIEL